ncbi:MAG: voltage-gated potassium channel [Bacteroidia bacterium]|jgi:voltage-gated potassium channel
MKKKLRKIIEDNTTFNGRLFDYVIQLLIVLSLIIFALETLPSNSAETYYWLHTGEIVLVFLFLIEYSLRIYVAKHPWQYVFSFYGIIDFLAIFPLFIGLAIDLSYIRIFRIFRIFRAFKLVRYNRAMHRFSIAARIIKEEIILFFLVSGIFIFLAAAGIYFFEHPIQPENYASIFDGLWWAVTTLTTVGYGDIYPVTAGGKVFTFFMLIVGVGIVTIPAGLVASSLSRAREIEQEEMKNKTSGSHHPHP